MMYVTYPNKESADEMVEKLLEEKLVACANVFSMESSYYWEDEINKDAEYLSILKTSYKNAPHTEYFIEQNHPYEVPCIVRWEVSCNLSYEKWLRSNIIER